VSPRRSFDLRECHSGRAPAAREPGPMNPSAAIKNADRDAWVPDRRATLAVRDDSRES
jgi:hypothetical protein